MTMTETSNERNAKEEQEEQESKIIFVTVGTTLFDKLISAICNETSIQWMISNNYTHLIIQYGKGKQPPLSSLLLSKMKIEMYRYKPTLMDDMKRAHLIISHAGAGTVMEVMKLQQQSHQRLVVVINTQLMDNHQCELANAMGARRHLFVVSDPDILLLPSSSSSSTTTTTESNIWDELNSFVPIPYVEPKGNEYEFPNLLDSFMGFK